MMEVDYSSLSDKELSEMLKDYGVDVGPVNMATRKVYERKLHKLKTGESLAPATKYEPVANDEDVSLSTSQPEVVTFKQTATPKKPQQTYQPPPPPKVIHKTPEPTQPRQRRDPPADIYSPQIDSRPSLNSARKVTRSYDPVVDQPRPKPSPSPSTTTIESSRGLPLWVKMVALAVVGVLLYLIYTNMESNAATNIPKIPGKMEI